MSEEESKNKSSQKKWKTLESNPELCSKYMHSLGVDSKWHFEDVLSFDDSMLSMVNSSVCALLVLFPLKDIVDARESGDGVPTLDPETYESQVFFMKQEVSNACGTVAIVHAVANNRSQIQLENGSVLSEFVLKASNVSLDQRTSLLGDDERIEKHHQETATEGKTRDKDMARRDLHFLTLTLGKNNRLYELDGRNPSPIDHGPSSSESFMKDAARVVRETLMAKANNSLFFSAMALVKKPSDDYDEAIATISSMGLPIDQQTIRDTLIATDGNVETALALLLDQ